MSKSAWRRRSALGRISRERGVASGRPRSSPPTIRTASLSSWPRRAGEAARRWLGGRRRPKRRLEIGVGGLGQLGAELIAEHAAAHLAYLPLGEVADLERAEG